MADLLRRTSLGNFIIPMDGRDRLTVVDLDQTGKFIPGMRRGAATVISLNRTLRDVWQDGYKLEQNQRRNQIMTTQTLDIEKMLVAEVKGKAEEDLLEARALCQKLQMAGMEKAAMHLATSIAIFPKTARVVALGYKYFTYDKITAYCNALNAKRTRQDKDNGYSYSINTEMLDSYKGAPPMNVINAILAAQEAKVFDQIGILSISSVKDPVVFGAIAGSPKMYFIAQWGDDITLDDLI